jgi:hypothetical protein
MRTILFVALAVGAACYAPRYTDLTRCGSAGDCPGDRSCVDGFCRVSSDAIDAMIDTASIDGALVDGPPIDASVIDVPVDSLECPPAQSDCDGVCVDLTNDPAHCGMCTRSCATGMCMESKCLEYIGLREGPTGFTCTPNGLPALEVKQMVNLPYPVTLLKLGVFVTSEGAPPYRQRIFRASAPTVQLASTADFFGAAMIKETPIAGGPLLIDAGDYLVSFIANDTCYGLTDTTAHLWAVVLH